MPLQVYSTLTRKKEPFPENPDKKVSMYLCGPTVYKPSHIGHMVGPVIFDTVKRYLAYLGYKVTWVVNITDVDDKLINRAKELKTTVPELAKKMTEDYFECLKKLNAFDNIDKFPRATDHIVAMTDLINALISKGYAYAVGSDVYFDVSKDPDYGKLCNRDPEQLEAGARLEVNSRKKNPGDFALWKGAKPGEPAEVQFDSPWGKGRPGWHIECSAMSKAILGETIDIHGGGLDLQFPHHENELAQSESANGQAFARIWMHNGLLKMGSAKMAGSVGNVVNIADLLQRHSADTVRFLLLSTHYRSPIEYSEDRLNEVKRSIDGYFRLFERCERITGKSFYSLEQLPPGAPINMGKIPADFRNDDTSQIPVRVENIVRGWKSFMDCMSDDFNTGGAMGSMFYLVNVLNSFADEEKLESSNPNEYARDCFHRGMCTLRLFTSILGLFSVPPNNASLGGDDKLVAGLMKLVIDLRNNLRAEAKGIEDKANPVKKALFAQTDLIRSRLAEMKITLEDRANETSWRVG